MVHTLMSVFSDWFRSTANLPTSVNSFLGSALKPLDQFLGKASSTNLFLNTNRVGKLQLCTSRRPLIVQAGYRYYLCHFFVNPMLSGSYGAKMHDSFFFG